MTYDTMKANVTVTVTKSGHALTAVATLPTDKDLTIPSHCSYSSSIQVH